MRGGGKHQATSPNRDASGSRETRYSESIYHGHYASARLLLKSLGVVTAMLHLDGAAGWPPPHKVGTQTEACDGHGMRTIVLGVVDIIYAERGIAKFGRALAKLCHCHGS